MDSTITRFAKTLGAGEIEIAGHDLRFAIDGPEGGRLRVSYEGAQQRFMCVLIDGSGVTRTTLDLAPITGIEENRAYPGRVTLVLASALVHIDSRPTLAIEIESQGDQKSAS